MLNNQKLRFLLVGAANTALGYGIFFTLYLLTKQHLHYLAIAVIAHILAVSIAFLNHRHLVFGSSGHWAHEFLRYNISHLLTLGLGIVILWLLVETILMHPLLAQGISTVITVSCSFFLHKYFSFNTKKRRGHENQTD